MTFDGISPFTGKMKEYANMGEWSMECEKFDRANNPPEKKLTGKVTYAQACEKAKKEMGIDLGGPASPQEQFEAMIEQRIAAGVEQGIKEALAKHGAVGKQETHSAARRLSPELAESLEKIKRIPWTAETTAFALKYSKEKLAAKSCGCTHNQKAEAVTHSAYATGPVMFAQIKR